MQQEMLGMAFQGVRCYPLRSSTRGAKHAHMSNTSTKPDYGIDAPGVVRNLFVAGVICLLLFRFLPNFTIGGVTFLLAPMFRNTGIGCLVGGVLMLIYSKYGKFKHRDR